MSAERRRGFAVDFSSLHCQSCSHLEAVESEIFWKCNWLWARVGNHRSLATCMKGLCSFCAVLENMSRLTWFIQMWQVKSTVPRWKFQRLRFLGCWDPASCFCRCGLDTWVQQLIWVCVISTLSFVFILCRFGPFFWEGTRLPTGRQQARGRGRVNRAADQSMYWSRKVCFKGAESKLKWKFKFRSLKMKASNSTWQDNLRIQKSPMWLWSMSCVAAAFLFSDSQTGLTRKILRTGGISTGSEWLLFLGLLEFFNLL